MPKPQNAVDPAIALAEELNQILPQTQCTRCGYPACKPYAQAIARGEADINQCPPGGQAGIIKIAQILGRPPKPLNPANGVEAPLRLAFIDEPACTGCELCIPPCPVDCIDMVAAPPTLAAWNDDRARDARERYERRNARLARERERKNARPRTDAAQPDDPAAEAKRALVAAAMERARALKAATKPRNTENLPPDLEQKLRDIDARRTLQGKKETP